MCNFFSNVFFLQFYPVRHAHIDDVTAMTHLGFAHAVPQLVEPRLYVTAAGAAAAASGALVVFVRLVVRLTLAAGLRLNKITKL